jgi:translation elongation factor aEF-1 beta
MGLSSVKLKTMPTSLDVDLNSLKVKIEEIIKENQGEIIEQIEEPVAFGLKAIITKFKWDQEKDSDDIANKISSIEEVNSCQVTEVSLMFA